MAKEKNEENTQNAVDSTEDVDAVAQGENEDAIAEAGEGKKYFELYARAVAELENYKKLSEKQIALGKFRAKEALVRRFLPVLDDFDAASEHQEIRGLKAIYDKVFAALASEGLSEISTDGRFDPFRHEAMQESESEKEPGTILQVVRKGYALDGNVIRPAMVIVAKNQCKKTNGTNESR